MHKGYHELVIMMEMWLPWEHWAVVRDIMLFKVHQGNMGTVMVTMGMSRVHTYKGP